METANSRSSFIPITTKAPGRRSTTAPAESARLCCLSSAGSAWASELTSAVDYHIEVRVNSTPSTMKTILILAATIVIGLGGQAFARLGQTEEQVTALFGKPIDAGTPDKEGVTTNIYKNPSGEYNALVQFLKGHSIAEAYSRVDGGKLSEKEMSIFLQG